MLEYRSEKGRGNDTKETRCPYGPSIKQLIAGQV